MTEDYVRQLLLSVDVAAATADPIARIRRRLRRRKSAVTVVTGLALVSLGAATAAMTSLGRSPDRALVPVSPRPPALTLADVPFAARSYPPLVTGRPTPTERFCRSGDLALVASTGPRGVSAIGVQLTVRLTNTTTTACQVPLRGSVQLTARTGSTIGQGGIGSNSEAAGLAQPAVPPAGAAILTGYWAQPCKSTVDPASVQVSLTPPGAKQGSEASVSGPVTAGPAPTCEPPLKVLYVGGTANLYSLVVLDAQQRRVDKPSLSLTAELVDIPTTVRLGQELRFGVRVHNPTRGPIPLTGGNCPLYATLLNRPGRSSGPDADGALNCQDAPAALPAGADIIFRFQFRVTASNFQPGAWTLYWTRTDGSDTRLQTPVRIS
jgi:hypothetical protein